MTIQFAPSNRDGAWSPDGSQWAFVTNDGEINVCNASSHQCDTRYIRQKLNIGLASDGWADYLVWSTDSKQIASFIGYSNVDIWNAATGERITTFEPSTSLPYPAGIAWSHNGKWMLINDERDYAVTLWDVQSGIAIKHISLPKGYSNLASGIAWNEDDTEFVIVNESQRYFVYDSATFVQKASFSAPMFGNFRHYESVTGMIWKLQGLLTSTEGSVRLWAANTGKILHSRLDYATYPNQVDWSPIDHRVATVHGYGQGQGDDRLRVWDADSGELLCVGEEHRWAVSFVAWSPDGAQIATGGGADNSGEDNRAVIWDAKTCAVQKILTTDQSLYAGPLSWSANGKQLILGNEIWDIEKEQRINQIKSFYALANPRNRHAAVNGGKVGISIWDMDTGAQLDELKETNSESAMNVLAWSVDGTSLASANEAENKIKIWDDSSGKLVTTIDSQNDVINTLAFSPDGRFIACAGGTREGYYQSNRSADNTIRIWEIQTGKLMAVLVGHTKAVLSIGWNADGTQLASVSEDETIRIWEISVDN